MEITIAHTVAILLGKDGSRGEADDGRSLDDIAVNDFQGHLELGDNVPVWRIEFPDGSAITGNVEGWDIEGDEPYSMESA